MEIHDNYKQYFQAVVCKNIIKSGGFLHKTRISSDSIKQLMNTKLEYHFNQLHQLTVRSDRIKLIKIMYDLIYEYNWLYMTYRMFPDIQRFMDVVIKKIDSLFIDGFYNSWMYCDMFK
jgi:hypothetical protein